MLGREMALESILLFVFKKVGTGIRGSINFTIHSKTSIQCLLSARHFTNSKVTAA